MARLLTIGYDVRESPTATIAADNPNGTTPVGSVSNLGGAFPRNGVGGCLNCNGTAAATAYIPLFTPAVSKTYFIRAYFTPYTALPTTNARILGAIGSTSISVMLTTAGKLRLWDNAGGVQIGSDSAATLASGGAVYYRVELQIVTNASTQITSGELRLDGVTVATFTGRTFTGTPAMNVGWLLAPGNSNSLFVDDVAVNDSTGSVNNSWPGVGKVVMLLPVSDSAVAAGWTLGTGTAVSANGFDAVNNTPPLGVADLAAGSDVKQIRDAGTTLGDIFSVNLTSYTTAGVGASDTVNVVQPWICTAAPSATSPKAGTIGVDSNPFINAVALSIGGFYSNVAVAGTYPTGWKWTPGGVAEAPAVTRGTSPVATIKQNTSSTRIAMVCFVGMYVDYTPAAAPKSLLPGGSRDLRSGAIPHLMIR